jgi:hypothetical protein
MIRLFRKPVVTAPAATPPSAPPSDLASVLAAWIDGFAPLFAARGINLDSDLTACGHAPSESDLPVIELAVYGLLTGLSRLQPVPERIRVGLRGASLDLAIEATAWTDHSDHRPGAGPAPWESDTESLLALVRDLAANLGGRLEPGLVEAGCRSCAIRLPRRLARNFA